MTTLDNFEVQTSYNYEESTEWNYTAEHMCFFGKYQELRASLDYTYHQNYTKERQLFQDEIIKKYSSSIVWDADGFIGSIPEKPWCVFTAGAMVRINLLYTLWKFMSKYFSDPRPLNTHFS